MLTAGCGIFLGMQLGCTLHNRNRWPFCSYNMFAYDPEETYEALRVQLIDDSGEKTLVLDPWGLLPLDFFRVISALIEIYVVGEDEERKHAFGEATLAGLNGRPWSAFDEVRPQLRPPPGRRFVGFDLLYVHVDASSCDPVDRSSCVKQSVIYTHRQGLRAAA
jgi:hypothetical protein